MIPAIEGGSAVRQKYLVFGSPMIEEAEIEEVVQALRSRWIGTGPKVALFESMFRDYTGSPHAVGLHSCTAALHLALLAAEVQRGDEVIIPAMTFCATANAVIHAGAKPVMVDVDAQDMNVTVHHIEQAITSKTKAIIPVHMAGRPCDMQPILDLAKQHQLRVIEDAAHATEAVYQSQKVGSLSDASCFSFYVTKNLVTGEGGMLTTPHADWAERIQVMGLHGMSRGAWKRYSDEGFKHYQVTEAGFKYNMMDLQAAIGVHQLPRMPRYLQTREKIWQRYDAAFSNLPICLPAPVRQGDVHARHLYTLLLDLDDLKVSRDHIVQALHAENIGTGIHFMGLQMHPYYQNQFGYRDDDFPVTLDLSMRTISLPLSAALQDKEVDDVIAAVHKVISYYRR